MNKPILTLTAIIALAIGVNIGFSSSVFAQQNRTEDPEIIREDETDRTNNEDNDSQRERDNEWRIINPSYPTPIQPDRSYPRLYDQNRSQRQRNYYEGLMQPYHPRYDLGRNSNSFDRNRRDYGRSRYGSGRGRDYMYYYRNR